MGDAPGQRLFRAVVDSVEDLSPSLRRVVFTGDDLASFASTGSPDEYLRVFFPAPGSAEPVLPVVVDGALDYGSIDPGTLRTYTVRRHDPGAGRVTIDFVLHDDGVATVWAKAARPGDAVGLNCPTGMYDAPADLAWQVLVADSAALPALTRILEQTRATVRNRVVVEVPGDEHRIPLPDHPRTDVTWVHGGNGHGPSRLEDVVRSLTRPPGDRGYVWVAGEARALRGVRRYLRHELGLPASAYNAVGYWIERAEEWNERYAALDDAARESLESLWEEDRPEEEIEDEYDRRLSSLGL